MKTTVEIDDTVMQKLREEAARQGRSVRDLTEALLSAGLTRTRQTSGSLPDLPTWNSGGLRVDVADRDSLLDAMGEMTPCPPPKS